MRKESISPQVMDDIRSFLGQRWVSRPHVELSSDVKEKLNLSSYTARLLAARGIRTYREAVDFLEAGVDKLGEPWDLEGADAAGRRIAAAVDGGERIVVYGDYDVDGQTSTALMVRVLRDLGAAVEGYIPHRIEEGYGLNNEALQRLRREGAELVVTVDCGISAIAEADFAHSIGLDLVITDHHEPPSRLPQASATVNPKLGDDPSLMDLAGCGVAFKVAEAACRRLGAPPEMVRRYIELVAVGTVADVVPLLGENRNLVKAGLRQLNTESRIPGLRALCDVAGIEKDVRAGHIGFVLGPRLNAVGRIADPTIGLRLLLCDNYEDSLPMAERLEKENEMRREIERKVVEAAKESVEQTYDLKRDRGLVVSGEGWHVGVVGIVASRLLETYFRPTIVLSIDGDTARGSGRSIPGFNLYEALGECADLFEEFGGHQAAAGLTIKTGNVKHFQKRFGEVCADRLSSEDLVPVLNVDGTVDIDDITLAWIEELSALEPFGMANPTPIFVCSGVSATGRAVGKEETHLKLALQSEKGGRPVDSIGFGMAEAVLPQLGSGRFVDVAFVPQVNEWKGRRTPSLQLKDLRPAEDERTPAALLLDAMGEMAAAFDGTVGVRKRFALNGNDGVSWDTAEMREGTTAYGWRVIDRRGAGDPALVHTLIDKGRSVYVVPGDADQGLAVAQFLANANRVLKRRTFLWSAAMDDRMEELARDAAARPPWVLVAADPPAFEDVFLTTLRKRTMTTNPPALVLWGLPTDPDVLRAHLLALQSLIGREAECILYLAFDPHVAAARGGRLIHRYPDRDRLGRIFVKLKEEVEANGRAHPQPVFVRVDRQWPRITSPFGVGQAFGIFEELELIGRDDQGWYLRTDPGTKVDLEQSFLYNVCNTLREGYAPYAKALAESDPKAFIERLHGFCKV